MKLGLRNVRVGYTGTQRGMTGAQKETFQEVLESLFPDELHHGDCIGGDSEAHDVACLHRFNVVIHPPIKDAKRAFCAHKGHGTYRVLEAKDYLVRNQDIVNASEVLVATPKGYGEELRSGTWSTVRRGVKAGKPVFVIWPDGTLKRWGS